MTAAQKSALLVLEDGRTFRGESYGAEGETFGEAVFATGMTGYQETLTDPSYHRQVVVMTAPHIGNTGVNDEDDESAKIWVSGYVVRDPARVTSNWRARGSLLDELRNQGVVGISGVDTRALTRHLRERGAMRVGISSVERDPEALLSRVRASGEMSGANLSSEVSTSSTYVVPAVGERRFTVAALDLGIKANTPRMLAERGIETHVLPADSTLDEVLAVTPDGLFFSNGPGDPAATTGQIALLQGALDAGIPYFGICFGNQLFGRALGFGTFKLKYGHRGINQPVMDRTTARSRSPHTTTGSPSMRLWMHRRRRRTAWPRSLTCASTIRWSKGSNSIRKQASCWPSRCSTTLRRPPGRTTRRTSSTASAFSWAGRSDMPKRTDISKILIIGSGPIVIGQACEFDYSGTQACKALKARRDTRSSW